MTDSTTDQPERAGADDVPEETLVRDEATPDHPRAVDDVREELEPAGEAAEPDETPDPAPVQEDAAVTLDSVVPPAPETAEPIEPAAAEVEPAETSETSGELGDGPEGIEPEDDGTIVLAEPLEVPSPAAPPSAAGTSAASPGPETLASRAPAPEPEAAPDPAAELAAAPESEEAPEPESPELSAAAGGPTSPEDIEPEDDGTIVLAEPLDLPVPVPAISAVEPGEELVEPEDDSTTVLTDAALAVAAETVQRTSVLRQSAPVEPSASEAVAAPGAVTEPLPATTDATAEAAGAAAATAVATAPPSPPRPADRSMIEDLPHDPPSRRGLKVGIAAGVVILAAAAAYVGAVLYTSDRTPEQASVDSVDVSALTRADAEATLTAALAEKVAAPVPIKVGDLAATLDPAQAGLALDAAASIDPLVGRSWDPRVVWDRLFGSAQVPVVAAIDNAALTSALANAQSAVAVAPVDATIAFANGQAVVTDPVDGAGLDVNGAVEVISTQWLQTEDTLDLPMTAVTPDLDQADVDAAMSEIVEPMLSAPVTVNIAPQEGTEGETLSAAIDQATLTMASSIVGQDGAFVLEMHGDVLVSALSESLPDIGTASKDASFEFVDGAPSIVPSQGGTGLDEQQLADVVEVAAVEATGRVAEATLISAEAEFTTEDAEALGVVEVIGEFSTPLPAGSNVPRTNNIRNGASKVTGVLLKPGETFSLLDALGPIDGAHGYFQSGVVVNGNVSEAWGGGLSQLSTTVFNAAFEAGLEDVTHQAHSRWFTRYPAGREATVFEGQIDMQFKNRTDHGVLVQAWVADGRTWARVWGTKTFNTTITSGEKYNYVASSTIYNTRDDCTPESGGSSGFTIDVRRVVARLDGTEVETRGYTTTYTPWNNIVCGPDPATTGG